LEWLGSSGGKFKSMTLSNSRLQDIWEKTSTWLWLGLVVSLPISSFPIFAKLLHTSSVAPASGIFVLLLTVIWLPLFILRKGRFPFQVKPALYFTLFCLVTIGLAFFRDAPFYPGSMLVSNSVEALATLGMGILFYLTASALPSDGKKISLTLRAINLGGMIMLGWALLQFIVWLPAKDFPQWVRDFQGIFSTTVLFDKRTTGFASEPSWLAHMLNMVYLPYWLAASLKKFTTYRSKIWIFSIENILLGLGVIVLFLTFSRVGLVAFMLVMAFLFVRLNVRFVNWIIAKWGVKRRAIVGILAGFVVFMLYIGVGILGLFTLSKIDPRMETVFQFSSTSENPIMKYAENLQFGERVAYWQTGWNIFNDHPIAGVGLNSSGSYFPKYMPEYGWQLTETKNLLFRSNNVLNIKNLWTRLLAETGIIGFSLFISFLIISLITAIELNKRSDRLQQSIGWMGILMLIAFLVEGFSVDSLALPYYWFTLGLVAATWRWSKKYEGGKING
jgi:O-antigen ligase